MYIEQRIERLEKGLDVISKRVEDMTKVSPPSPPPIPKSAKKKVFASAGHGVNRNGVEYGAANYNAKTNEHELNVIAATWYVKTLESFGIRAEFYDDPNTLFGTGAASKGYDIFVEFHCNASKAHNAQGVECWRHKTKGDPADKILGDLICSEVWKEIGVPNRGTKSANFGVLSGAESVEHYKNTQAQCLIELFFMDVKTLTRNVMLDWAKRGGIASARATRLYLESLD